LADSIRLSITAARSPACWEPTNNQFFRLWAPSHNRKNWLFSDTVAGANASANLYSLMQTCAVNAVDGYKYLRALLVALPKAQTADDYEALLPWTITLPTN
jgi:hypothetical protein